MESPKIDITPVSFLYVEDDPASRAEVGGILAKAFPSLAISTAENGALGLAMARERTPDIVLTNLQMPVMGGIQMAAGIRKINPGVRIIAAAALSDTGCLLDAIKIGIHRYVLKPFDFDLLVEAIEECIAQITLGRQQSVGRDIAGRQEAERALREREVRYQAMVMAFDGLMYICSPDCRIEFMNEAMKVRTGHDATGEFCYQALHGLTEICPWCMNERVFAGESVRWEVQSPKDGHWYEVSNTPIANANGTVSKQAMILDITERKELEAELIKSRNDLKIANELLEQRVSQRTEDLQAALREQESFSYSVSHDLRAPLRHINCFSAMLVEVCGDGLQSEARDYLGRIRAASSKMGELIDHLLELSQVTRAELSLGAVDLSELAAATLHMFGEIEPGRRCQVVIEPGIVVLGDSHLLQHLLYNLLGNAWKYTSKKQSARIEFGKVMACGEEAYFVEDNGEGFDMTYQGNLFKPFERLHGADFEGVGIGLATAQRIVHRHGGQIWGEGEVGRGATFYFTLPVYF